MDFENRPTSFLLTSFTVHITSKFLDSISSHPCQSNCVLQYNIFGCSIFVHIPFKSICSCYTSNIFPLLSVMLKKMCISKYNSQSPVRKSNLQTDLFALHYHHKLVTSDLFWFKYSNFRFIYYWLGNSIASANWWWIRSNLHQAWYCFRPREAVLLRLYAH